MPCDAEQTKGTWALSKVKQGRFYVRALGRWKSVDVMANWVLLVDGRKVVSDRTDCRKKWQTREV